MLSFFKEEKWNQQLDGNPIMSLGKKKKNSIQYIRKAGPWKKKKRGKPASISKYLSLSYYDTLPPQKKNKLRRTERKTQ